MIDQNEFFDKRIASKDVRGYYLIKKGEFAYNKSTSVDAPLGAIKRLDKYNNGVLSTLYILFKIIDDTSTGSDYLVTYYATDLWHRGIQSIAAEGARNHGLLNIAPNDFFETMLSIPLNISEQKKVGDFFISLDHLITLHQSKSFGHILKVIVNCTLSWEQRKLGEIGSVAMCHRIFKYQTTESGDIPFFKIGSFGGTPDAFISKDLFESFKVKYPYPEKGDVLISASGSIGRTVVFTGKDEYFQDSNIVWLKHNNNIINSFLNYLYSIVKWAGIEGSTIKRLYNDNILKTEAIIPTLLEQQKISDYLDGINHLITLHQSKLEKLQKIKKSMLESMFV